MSLKSADEILGELHPGMIAGLQRAAELVGEAADANVPMDTGELRDSREIEIDAVNLKIGVSYGRGIDDLRAVITHEKTELHHDSGGAKYLESAMASELTQVGEAIAEEIRKETN